MKARRYDLDSDAKRLMGMSGIEVYECRYSPDIRQTYFDVVWRGRPRWAVTYPWHNNKHILVEVGQKLRNRAAQDEEFERAITQSERERAAKEAESADTVEVMTRDVCRTVIDKPQYYY